MAKNSQFGQVGGAGGTLDCVSFEALLMDALDGLLTPAKEFEFRRHRAECAKCGTMFAEIESGMVALKTLEEVEAPEHLLHNVLAKTSYAHSGTAVRVPGAQAVSLWKRMREGVLRPVLQPRFAMSLGMAFFSITLILNVAGVTKKDLVTLRPSTLRTTATVKLNEAEGRILKYYENLRIVYEFESLVRDVKKNEKKPETPKGNQDTSEARPVNGIKVGRTELAKKLESVGPSETEMHDQQYQQEGTKGGA